MLEVLANLEGPREAFPDSFQLMKVDVPDGVSVEVVDPAQLQEGWENNRKLTQALGDSWLRERRSVLLAVPSVPSPVTVNYVLNPLHAEAVGVVPVWSRKMRYDTRLFRLI